MRVFLSKHAVARYQERVRPTVELDRAEAELRALISACEPVLGPVPEGYDPLEPSDGWLEVSDGVLLACQKKGADLVATTVLVRGMGYEKRRRREAKRKRRRARARARHGSNANNRGQIRNPEGYGGLGWAD